MRGAGSVWDFMTKKPFPNDFLALAFCCQGRRFWNLPRHVLVCRICHCSCRCCFRFIGVLVALFFVFRMGKIAGAAEQKEKRDSFFWFAKVADVFIWAISLDTRAYPLKTL
jgi:hypothetical protein